MIKYRMKVLTYGKITLDWKVMKNEIIDLLAKAQGYESTNPRKKAQAATAQTHPTPVSYTHLTLPTILLV